jgi:hypothetical protein
MGLLQTQKIGRQRSNRKKKERKKTSSKKKTKEETQLLLFSLFLSARAKIYARGQRQNE